MGKKQLIKIQIIFLSLIILLLGQWFVSKIIDNSIESGWLNTERTKEYEVKVGEIQQVRVNLVSENIEIYTIQGESILIKQKGNGLKENTVLDISRNGDTLTIKKPMKNFFNFDFVPNKEVVEIYMPKAAINSLDIETVSGDIMVKEREVEKLSLRTTSGDCEVKDTSCTDVTLYTVSGEIEYEGRVMYLDTGSTSGDVELKLKSVVEEVDIETVSGNVEVECLKNQIYRIKFDSISGKLKSSKEYNDGENGGKINIRTVSGDGKLKFN